MWEYSEKVKQHFFDPKNAGAVVDANAVGDVGSLSCGDALRLTLKVNPESERIDEAGFQTFGCGSAIASSSALTELIKGLTLDEALKIDNQDIADFLDGLPPEKMHCSVMGQEALEAAVANYRGEEIVDDHEEGALICKCFAVDDIKVRETVRKHQLSSVEDVTNYTKAGGACSSCHEAIEHILEEELSALGQAFKPAPIAKRKAAANVVQIQDMQVETGESYAPKKKAKLSNLQRMKLVEKTLEGIRPTLQRDHGDVELIEIDGKHINVSLKGACTSCQLADDTLSGLQKALIDALGELVELHVLSEKQQHNLGGL
ncbi:Fe-S cluster assembly protein NifU [Agaribacterium sp. ZY112]|uniref:Fe-S cluster assembly protein NifU n=1 Tax=Agaribacterium sp. ZY112 TaxID=3233574 RepID=UPI00352365AA